MSTKNKYNNKKSTLAPDVSPVTQDEPAVALSGTVEAYILARGSSPPRGAQRVVLLVSSLVGPGMVNGAVAVTLSFRSRRTITVDSLVGKDDAERNLKQDVKDGVHLTLTTDEFYNSRPEYQLYEKTTIYHYVHQEMKTMKLKQEVPCLLPTRTRRGGSLTVN